jgi:hypothetical protein
MSKYSASPQFFKEVGKSVMKAFRTWWSYWDFTRSVQHNSRYIFDQRVKKFLQTVVQTSKDRKAEISKGSILYRAQRGCTTRPVFQNDEHVADEEWPYPPDRMLPEKGKSSEGRANPRGITYLYLASNRDTACAEVRPWKGAFISVAAFKVRRELKVVDCSKDVKEKKQLIFHLKQPSPKVREKSVWAEINKAFSKPVNPHDPETEYVPTQIIAELFSKEGYDGVTYQSSLATGLNLVLFHLDAVELISCFLTKTKDIKFEFDHWKLGYSPRKIQK